MNWTPDDWGRLGARIRSERESRGISRETLGKRSGVSGGTIQNVEGRAVPKGRWPHSLGAIEAGLGWAPGSMKAILNGGEPTEIRDAPERQPSSAPTPRSVSIPADLYVALVRIAAHVSAGRAAAFVQGPYPDAVARRTLGALEDAGLLDQIRPVGVA